MKSLLIIFYRNPELGKVKTRLAATLGDEQALAIYLKLVNHTRAISDNLACDKVVYYSAFVDTEDAWSNAHYRKQLQQGDDLGQRMAHAVNTAFQEGYQRVCIIGTDCWELTTALLEDCFSKLLTNDAVLGPAKDGGYYLLGLARLSEKLFENKKWSSSTVAEDTRNDFRTLNWKWYELETLSDIDEEADLKGISLR